MITVTRILRYIDPTTRDYRTAPPDANRYELAAWEIHKAEFVKEWESFSEDRRRNMLDEAIIVSYYTGSMT